MLHYFMGLARGGAAAACVLAVAAACALPARATGTVVVQQADGSVQRYPGTTIKFLSDALYLTSQDGKGTLVINRADCMVRGHILTCFPTGASLVQPGDAGVIDVRGGAIYYNLSASAQQLSHSSTQLPPRGILMTLRTKRGTYINLSGSVDKADNK